MHSSWRSPRRAPGSTISSRGRVAGFADIAAREHKGERHIRLLAPLAFVSPQVVAAIIDGTAPADLTITGLAKALPYSWAAQERRIRLHASTSSGFLVIDPDR